MRKIILLLIVLLLSSCVDDDNCDCIKTTYNLIDVDSKYSLEFDKKENVVCTDELIYWENEYKLVIVNCN